MMISREFDEANRERRDKEKMKTGLELIREERKRQIEKGYTADHDDTHTDEELADGAALYALSDDARSFIDDEWGNDMYLHFWQFELKYLKFTPNNRIKQLTKAGAMIVAEIERLQRLELNDKVNRLNKLIK